MPRKELTVVTKYGRDKDKVFHIQEMSAAQAEDWAVRLFLALARSGVEIPENIAGAGLAGVAFLSLSMLGGVRYEDAAPLLSEMFGCIQVIPDPNRVEVRRRLIDDDIEEVKTRLELRAHVIELHTGFSVTAALSKNLAPTAVQKSNSPSTSTSPGP